MMDNEGVGSNRLGSKLVTAAVAAMLSSNMVAGAQDPQLRGTIFKIEEESPHGLEDLAMKVGTQMVAAAMATATTTGGGQALSLCANRFKSTLKQDILPEADREESEEVELEDLATDIK